MMATVSQLGEEVEDDVSTERIECGGRLVEDEQGRRVDERLGDAEPLPHAARVAADARVDAAEARELEQFVDPSTRRTRRQAEETGTALEHLASGHPGEEAGRVGAVADAGAHGGAAGFLTEHANAP